MHMRLEKKTRFQKFISNTMGSACVLLMLSYNHLLLITPFLRTLSTSPGIDQANLCMSSKSILFRQLLIHLRN